MTLGIMDIAVFTAFVLAVIGLGMFKSRREKTSEEYFLAGRGLVWPLIGLSIVAANLSTEQFVGMAGQSAGDVGLAVTNWQLSGAVAIIIVAFFFLPRFLSAGIYTMPEYLEYRYNTWARGIMAVYTVIIYVLVTSATVLYSGGLTLHTIFNMPLAQAIWLIGLIAAAYTVWGGLKAVAWADLLQGGGLLLGGFITLFLGLKATGGWDAFVEHNADRLHMILPADHPVLPWTALLLGMWIPNFYYCGLNQFIMQRTLAAKSLRHGQLGIILAAGLWVLVPFFIVIPGIIAHQLYGDSMGTSDQAYPMLIRNLIPSGVRGFMLAAIAGAVISSLASMLNSASTIFTMDLYKRYLHAGASQRTLVFMGRGSTLFFVVVSCLIAPFLGNERFGGIFNYIQEFQGYISPGILAAFVFGFVVKRAPRASGAVALLISAPIYGFLQWHYSDIAYLNRMAITLFAVFTIMGIMTLVRPNPAPRPLPVRMKIERRADPVVMVAAMMVLIAIMAFYWVFW